MAKQNKQKGGCGCLTFIGFIIMAIIAVNLFSCDNKNDDNTVKEDKTEQASSSSEESSSEESSSEELPKMTADKMPDFIEYFQNDLTEKGIDTNDVSFDNEDTILHLIVPESYKDYSDSDMLAFAEQTQDREHEAFNVWAGTNGIDYSDYPFLVIMTESGERLASETITGDMKIK